MFQNLLLLYPARRQRRIDALARHVAEQCIDDVAALVAGNIHTMSLCEARGYIRARAAHELRRKTRQSLKNLPEADGSWEADIVSRAADRIAPIALRRCTRQRQADQVERYRAA